MSLKNIALLFFALLLAGVAQANEYKDHPMIGGYPGARLSSAKVADYDVIALPTSIVTLGEVNKVAQVEVKGKVSQYLYEKDDVSTLQIYENYLAAITKAGFKISFSCKQKACGSQSAAVALGESVAMDHNIYAMYEQPYYILANNSTGAAPVHGAWFIGGLNGNVAVQPTIVEEKPMANGLIAVDPGALKDQIDAGGKALIYGIYFDTGKAVVKPESKPAMNAIAQLLTRNKDLLLYVVGHTDDTGTGATNVELSHQRALAVVAELVAIYKIAAPRLQAQGVGPYAPIGSNTTDTGKQRNRRVELVKRLQ